MSFFTGTFDADGQVSSPITLRPGQSVSYSFTTVSLTGSVVFERTSKLGAGYTVVETFTDSGSGSYINETHEEEYVRVRCVELDDDPGSETVIYTLEDVEQNDTFEYTNTYGLVKEAEISSFARIILSDTDAESVRTTIGVPSIVAAEDAQASVVSQLDFTSSEPTTPTNGDRYINTATGASSESSQSVTENYIYEWDGSLWSETIPNEGAICTDENANLTLLFNGSAWINLAGYTVHNSLTGLQGGTSSEYYHLTSAQHTALAAIVTAGAGLDALTSDEVDQLENIGSTTISAAQWGYLGGLDQSVATSGTPSFASITINASVDEALTINSTQQNAEIRFGPSTSIHDLRIGGYANSGVTGFYVETHDVTRLFVDGSSGYVGIGALSPSTLFHLEEDSVIDGAVYDNYSANLYLRPKLTVENGGSHTITRHNYINVKNITKTETSGSITVTDACVFRFDDSAANHHALEAAPTTSGALGVNTDAVILKGTLAGSLKINVNGAVKEVPYFDDIAFYNEA